MAMNPVEAGICTRQARPGCRRGLPGCPQHERYWRAVAGLCRACDLEAGTLIEGDGTRIRSLEVSGQMAPVDRGKAGPQQLAAEAPPLQRTVHAKPRQAPVRIRRTSLLH